jgi:dihydroorotase
MARQAALRVAFHAEEREMIEGFETALRESGRTDPLAHLEAREASEATAIAHIGGLLVQTRAAGHILHLSTQAGLEFVDELRTALDVTCEVTPHHLLLERDVYAKPGGVARVNPPIRGGDDAAALRAALADGRIDMVATDHAPHRAEEKQRASIWDVPSGFAGVETMLSLLLTRGVHEGWMSLERLVAVTSEAPARIWGLSQKGRVEPGADADLTIIDLDKLGTISAATLHGLNNLSPFEGWSTRGAGVTTIVRGRPVVRDGALVGEPGWGANVVR